MQSEDGYAPSRRTALKLGGGLLGVRLLGSGALAAALGGGIARPARAAEQAPIGTWPAGVAGDSVFVGVGAPRTGTYAVQGEDELKGYELVFEHLNSGDELIKRIAPKVTKGLLGKQIVHGVADTEAKPNVAIQAQSRFIAQNRALLITGSCSSAVAVALNKLAQREKVIYLPGVSGSNDTTGKDCTRYSFRTCFYGQMSSAALSPVLIKTLGKNKKAAYLTPDYTYGHTVQQSMQQYLAKGGWTVATNQVCPLGTTDFSSYLLNVSNSGADVLINIEWGNDAVESIKQANQFGLMKKMTLVIAYQVPLIAKQVGPEIMQGILAATDFWWTIEGQYPLTKLFVEAFEKKFGYKPDFTAEEAYMQIALWARKVSETGTFYPPEVIKTYENGEHMDSLVGDVWFRPEDHQLVRPVFIVRGKKPSEMKSADDYWDVIETVPGQQLMQPPGAFGCHLGPYV